MELQIPQDAGVAPLLEALELRPTDGHLCLSIGQALEERGALDEAERAYRRAVAIEGSIAARRQLAMLLLARGSAREALDCLRTAIDLSPEDPDLRVLAAVAKEECGNEELAIAELTQAATRWPDHIETHRQLGRLLGRTGAVWACAEACRTVLELSGGDPEAKLALAIAWSGCGEHELAIEALEELVEASPASAERAADLAMALLAAGRIDAAKQRVQRALELDPKLAQAHCVAGLLQHESGNLAEAIVAFRRAVELAPEWAAARVNLGLALYHAWDLSDAKDALMKAEALLPGDPRIKAAIDEIQARNGEGGKGRAAELEGDTMSGDLSAFFLADLLEFLYSQRASGTLILDAPDGVGLIVIRRGSITAASSPQTVALDQQPWIAADRGAIERALRDAAERTDDPDLLARLLLREGADDPTQLRQVLEEQASAAVKDMVGWRAGRFSFRRIEASRVATLPEPIVALDPKKLVRRAGR